MRRSTAVIGGGLLALITIVGALVVYGSKDKSAVPAGTKPPAPTPPAVSVTELPPVQVLVRKAAQPGRVVYRYRVINGSAFPITSVLVGFDYLHSQPELRMFDNDIPAGNATTPNGWHFDIQPTEEDSLGNLIWEVDDPNGGLGGGQQLVGFAIALPAEEAKYENGHWTVYLNTAAQTYYSAALVPETGQVAVPPSSVEASAGVRLKPNPSRGVVDISFDVAFAGVTTVSIYDVRGRMVKDLMSKALPQGESHVTWDGTNKQGAREPAGTYFVRIKTPSMERFARISWLQ